MPYSSRGQDLLSRFVHTNTEGQLFAALEKTTAEIGFSYFAMGHHVDLLRPPNDAVRLCNYQASWIEHSLAERYYVNDPIHYASTKTAAGFLWSSIPEWVSLSIKQLSVLHRSREYGLSEGFTVPVHIPGEYRGTCSFAAANLDRVRRHSLPVANLAGIYAFEAARRIMRARAGSRHWALDVPVLTGRQHDALVLMARGKGDPEIASLLGIAASTAHEHVENVRRLYGNAQRVFLVVRALFDGQISWWEVFGR